MSRGCLLAMLAYRITVECSVAADGPDVVFTDAVRRAAACLTAQQALLIFWTSQSVAGPV